MTDTIMELATKLVPLGVAVISVSDDGELLYIDLGDKIANASEQHAVSSTMVIDYYDGFQFSVELADYSVNAFSIEPMEVDYDANYKELSPADFAEVVATVIDNLPHYDDMLKLAYGD